MDDGRARRQVGQLADHGFRVADFPPSTALGRRARAGQLVLCDDRQAVARQHAAGFERGFGDRDTLVLLGEVGPGLGPRRGKAQLGEPVAHGFAPAGGVTGDQHPPVERIEKAAQRLAGGRHIAAGELGHGAGAEDGVSARSGRRGRVGDDAGRG